MKNNQGTIFKLQSALNTKGLKILCRTSQFYSNELNRPVTMHYIDQAYWDEEAQKDKKTELFHSTSQLQIILFLRDVLYIAEGKPLPVDNEIWNGHRKTIEYYQSVDYKLEDIL